LQGARYGDGQVAGDGPTLRPWARDDCTDHRRDLPAVRSSRSGTPGQRPTSVEWADPRNRALGK
jgi:hypothetical protein